MKVLGLIEQDLDIVSKEYVDNKVKEVAKVDDVAPEGYVKIDPTSLWGVYKVDYNLNRGDIGYSAAHFGKILKNCITKDGNPLVSADSNIDEPTSKDDKVLEVIKENPICYIKKEHYNEYILNYFKDSKLEGYKIDTILAVLWYALYYKANNRVEDFYEGFFELIEPCYSESDRQPIQDIRVDGNPIPRTAEGLDDLMTRTEHIYVDSAYRRDTMVNLDKIIKTIISGNFDEEKNPSLAQYIKVDLPSLVMAIPSDENYKAAQTTKLSLLAMLISNASDKNAVGIFHKYQITEFTEEMLEKIMLNDPEVYVEKKSFKNVLDTVNLYSPALLEKNIFGGAIKINTSSLYMISNLLKNILPNGLKINPDVWCEKVLISCMNRDGKMVDISGKSITEVIGTEKEVYIDGDTFNDLIIKTITEDFKPAGKRKGYELMKTHYAIYLLSLAHAVRGGETEGLNQKFFKLIKDGYDVNEYNAEKTLVKDLGFTYNESAPESSYSANALSNFADKHPEIYVPTAFTEYVKGTAGATMEIVGTIMHMSQFFEAHKNDPKIKIVTPNEYKINRKDPDTLYIVKES